MVFFRFRSSVRLLGRATGWPENPMHTFNTLSNRRLAVLAVVAGPLAAAHGQSTISTTDRYASPLPQIVAEVEQLAAKVAAHLQKMGAY